MLARKYRPQTFAEVVGQDHVVRALRNALETGRIAHAFLFVGPRGIGKTSLARILAKALNCSGGPKADFNPDDPVCREIAEGRSMDVIEIDGASNNGVEQVRELREGAQYAPSGGRFKIYIIDEVHMLSQGAFNALLKTLEEPPAHVKFIFATTEVHKLPATILSRCQRYDLRRIPDSDMARHLRWIGEREGVEISEDALVLLARNAEGGLRDAESALDQLITFCGRRIEERDVLEMFGLTGIREVWRLAEAIEAGDAEGAIVQVRELVGRGKDLVQLARELTRYFRNQLIFQISPELARQQLDPGEVHHFSSMRPLPGKDLVLVWIEELVRLEEKLRHALVREVIFEIAMIRLSQQRERVELEHLLKALTGGGDLPPLETGQAKTVRTDSPAAFVAGGVNPAPMSPGLASAPVLPPGEAAEVVTEKTDSPARVEAAGKPGKVQTDVPKTKSSGSAKSKEARREATRGEKEEFYKDPAIQMALERFEARIVEVKMHAEA